MEQKKKAHGWKRIAAGTLCALAAYLAQLCLVTKLILTGATAAERMTGVCAGVAAALGALVGRGGRREGAAACGALFALAVTVTALLSGEASGGALGRFALCTALGTLAVFLPRGGKRKRRRRRRVT